MPANWEQRKQLFNRKKKISIFLKRFVQFIKKNDYSIKGWPWSSLRSHCMTRQMGLVNVGHYIHDRYFQKVIRICGALKLLLVFTMFNLVVVAQKIRRVGVQNVRVIWSWKLLPSCSWFIWTRREGVETHMNIGIDEETGNFF